MNRVALNTALLAGLAGSAGLNLAIRPDLTRPNREFFPEMVRTVAYDSFAPNPNFADGKTLRAPVPGTVIRPGSRLPEARAGRGGAVFVTFCQPCHGASGKGDGPVAMRGYPPPASLLGEKAIAMSDDQIFAILTKGRGNMPSYASQLSADDRRNAIAYVRSMQRKAEAK
jgi:mono/diheme cytochrome c family protein